MVFRHCLQEWLPPPIGDAMVCREVILSTMPGLDFDHPPPLALPDGTHSQDGCLRRVDDGNKTVHIKHTQVADGNVEPSMSSGRTFPSLPG